MSTITIVVPVYNNGAALEACLAAIRNVVRVPFELLVVDDGSFDGAQKIARHYADDVIRFERNGGRVRARNAGLAAAKGDLIVFIDSDIIIGPFDLLKIKSFFDKNPDVSAVTGRLSSQAGSKGFFSEYKNLYMCHIFEQLPTEVVFLYGSIFALRATIKRSFQFDRETVEDTFLGQMMSKQGHKICLLKELEVVHLKEYSAWTFLANDFNVPFHWARMFWASDWWKKIFKKGPLFAHASKEQVLSLFLAVAAVTLIATPLNGLVLLLWLYLNVKFIAFLFRKKGFLFGVAGAVVTFVDHIVMFSGVVAGTVFLFKSQAFQRRPHG